MMGSLSGTSMHLKGLNAPMEWKQQTDFALKKNRQYRHSSRPSYLKKGDSNYSSGELKLNTEIDSTEEPHKAIAKLEENGLSATSKIELARNGNGNASEAFREVTAEGIFNMYFLGVAAVAGIIVFVHFKEREQDDISAK
ncbi:unnamed protein product [Peronospora destructor]|uniref:Uncharacterized protein n=1 Tax=Peronospora destructor TaxID=86335 RepID=A0AAV0TB12_9STRA|nr:unnamed protein product [Peronospora destructor]